MSRPRRPSPAPAAPAPADPLDRRPEDEEDPLVPFDLIFGDRVITIRCPASAAEEAERARREAEDR